MRFLYQSGDEIQRGDRVRLHGELGEIEFIADPLGDPSDWYVKEHGGGVMIVEPKSFGRLFINARDIPEYEDLEFVSRGS